MKTEFYFNQYTNAFTLVYLNTDSIQRDCAIIGKYVNLFLMANNWNCGIYHRVMPDLVLESFGKKVSNIPQSLKNFLLNNKML